MAHRRIASNVKPVPFRKHLSAGNTASGVQFQPLACLVGEKDANIVDIELFADHINGSAEQSLQIQDGGDRPGHHSPCFQKFGLAARLFQKLQIPLVQLCVFLQRLSELADLFLQAGHQGLLVCLHKAIVLELFPLTGQIRLDLVVKLVWIDRLGHIPIAA